MNIDAILNDMENDAKKELSESQVTPQEPHILKSFGKGNRLNNFVMVLSSILVVVLGVLSGWFLSGKVTSQKTVSTNEKSEGKIDSKNEAGMEDESIFPDTAEGKLVEGGTDLEGTHHLERSGGVSQNVYLTSTVIDLQGFVGKKVKVWGQTISGQKSGWLMEVGKIKIVE